MKFKALVLREIDKNPEVELLQLTKKLSPTQSLIKIEKSGLCGAQLQEISGEKGNKRFLPHCMGHEGYGTIVETSNPNFVINQKVVLHWRNNFLKENEFYSYSSENGPVGAGPITTLSEYAVIDNSRITVVSDINPNIGALLGCALTTAYGIVNHENNIKDNDEVLITGAGGLGLSILAMLNRNNTYVLEKNISMLKKQVINTYNGILINTDDLNSKKKYNYIIDTTGADSLITNLLEKLIPGGKLILVSKPKNPIYINPNILYSGSSGITIQSTQGGSSVPYIDIPNILNINSNRSLEPLVTHDFDIEYINIAIEYLKTGKAGRIVFTL